MAIREIRIQGDSVLEKKCKEVKEVTPRIRELIDDMLETMRDANGCGLAAPQVGILRRIVIVEVEPGEVYEMINPKIIASGGVSTLEDIAGLKKLGIDGAIAGKAVYTGTLDLAKAIKEAE